MKTLPTWSRRNRFSYAGSVGAGTTISYGSGHIIFVTPGQYSSLLDHFRGMTVDVWASRTGPPARNVSEWLQANVTKTAIASYVCPILIDEGFAEKVGRSQIAFAKR